MIFTTIGRVLAYLAVFFGASRIGIGLYAAITDNQAIITRYLGSGTSGEAIDAGAKMFAAGLVLGILTDISRSVRR